MKIKLISLIVLLTFFVSCNQADKKEKNVKVSTTNFIQLPIKNADIPFKEYSVDAEKGDTIFYQTGSIILFPPNSFVDKNGNVIKGNVRVKYREFTSPIDFYLSGIPMSYDSSGKQYTFESSGMCEILAYKDSLPVFVNPKSKPEINIVTQNTSQEHNLYYLDTTQQKWVNKGTSIITDLNKKVSDNKITTTSSFTEITEPLKPEKANTKSPVIKIVIDPASFKELLVYDNLQFQLDPNEKNFNPKDTAGDWSNVELVKGSSKGLYTVKFSNASKTISYAARPVLEGNDYDKALKIFDKKNKEYQKKLNERLNTEKTNKDQNIKDSIAYSIRLEENKRIERLNALIEIRNKEIEKQNAIVEKINKQIVETSLSNKLMRSFEVDGFGIWNCDKAIALNCLPIVATFKDNKGNLIEMTNVAVLYKSFNGILKFIDNQIQVVKDADNMIIGLYNGKFAYITYNDYNKLKINADSKEQIFTMTVVEEKDNNYDFIKTVAGRQ
jgi:hypothetical protein